MAAFHAVCQDRVRPSGNMPQMPCPVNSQRSNMQGTQLLLQDLPTHLRQETDTAHPQPLIPIYYIHDGPRPFCTDPACFCARSKQDATRLFGDIAQGSFFLLEAANLLDTGSNTTSTNQLRKTFVTIHIVEGIPEECQLYGHSWEQTAEHPDVKECTLCQVRGYCPGCTPIPPVNAQAFICKAHGSRGQVEQ